MVFTAKDLALLACRLASIDCSVMGLPWTTVLLLSTLWIIWRVYLVLQKPVDELEEILGIDVPPMPEISLSSIAETSIILYWKPPDNYHSPLRQLIQINGVNYEEVDHSTASVQLTNLHPGFYYGIRAISTNDAGNSTYSRLIQVQTIPKDGNHGVKLLADAEQNHVKRTVSGRRVSQSMPISEQAPALPTSDSTGREDPDSDETINALTRKLDLLRRQKDESERELKEEIEDAEKQKLEATAQRDSMKRALDEKEKAAQELKKQVNELERQSKTSQRRRQGKEKMLQQKKAERQKMREDIERWMGESVGMQEKINNLKTSKVELEEAHVQKIDQAQVVIEAAQSENKSLEEEIKNLGIKIKDLEEERKHADRVQSEEEEEADRRERELEQEHETRIQRMQNEYYRLWRFLTQAENDLVQTQEYYNALIEIKDRDPSKYTTHPAVDYPALRQRRNRQTSSRLSSSTYPSNIYTSPSAFGMGPSFPPSGAVSTGMNARSNHPVLPSITARELDFLSGTGPMSPTANQLLPSDLLGDDDLPNIPSTAQEHFPIDPLSQRSSSWEPNNQDPQSPLSVHSASPSVLSSPHESFSNIPSNLYSGIDADRQSLGSTGSPYHQALQATSDVSSGRRRASIFNFTRQRPKSSLSSLPQLGSLKAGQSQSFPLDEQDAPTSGRKKLGSNMWSSPIPSFLNRGNAAPTTEDEVPSNLPRKTKRGLFGSKLDPSEALAPFERSTSPRPPSTNSYDFGLPRPSSDSHPFGWASGDARQRSSPLGGEWAPSVGTTWSRNPSRRQSVQLGSTSNLSLGSTPINPDELQSQYGVKPPQPAPIGTERFAISKSKAKNPPKQLNPAAPSFKTRLFPKKEKTPKVDKSADSEASESTKSKHRSKDRDKEIKHAKSRDSDFNLLSEDSLSYSSPRLSRDTYSLDDESAPSLEPTTSAAPSSSGGDLLAPTSGSISGSSAPKESLMQRLTRKGSSSKFSAAWRERGSLFSKKNTGEPGTPGEQDEDGGSDYLGKSLDGASLAGSGTPGGEKEKERSGRLSSSWGRVMSMKGKAKVREKEGRDSEEVEREAEEE